MAEMSEVVIVTLPEVVSNQLPSVVEEDKAVLVATELAPQAGEDILTVTPVDAETEATADSMSKEEAVIVKLSEEVDVEADVFYPITCGDAKATLVWKKFVCPGINVKCVQFTDQLISPKEFVCLAGKSTLKDWKRAIRLNGTMLRKIMDSGELDFYQHGKVCSNTCRSTKIDLVGTKVSVSCDPPADLLSASASSADLNGAAVSLPDVTEEPSEWVTTIGEDSVVFWRAVKEAGLLEEVVEDFQKEVQEMLKGLQERVCDPPVEVKDAVLLNNIVQNFGMLDLVKRVLASHKSQMDRYREQYTRSLAALEQQCDEHRKRAKELKSKSQHLNNVLMNLTPAPSPPAAKRPRLTRAVSGPAAVNATPTQIALPLGQLSGLTVAGAQAGSYTLLTSPLSGSELGADGSNVTVLSAATGQGAAAGSGASGSFVKVVGPQFQLVTLPLATQNPAVQQQVSTVTVVDATVTTADELQEVSQADGEEEGQPGQAMEEEEEQQ
ncbi:glucocorticoid modulatory element-binding protein 2 [Poecilia latipinna]|uniref:Glucocorticoid modulatory element binding protein 2 n=1 Tax=Poecilia latipinna TaxID=48699 RepID=A0A3B3UQT8_9TELE|nr:PREDICTED: glucocorticoid modulatory element-binding protein 2-like [Poecilia latipinna]XP_014908685.1 PREDICTED: glucocorticoid modulatory element-binding protein 2-like [Poecilia latipinna]